jgi:hypothetical protein
MQSLRRRTYDLLKMYDASIYVRSWCAQFPGEVIHDITRVYTNSDDLEIDAEGPCPIGFKSEYRIKSLSATLRYGVCTVPENDLRLPDLSNEYTDSSVVDHSVKASHNALLALHASGIWTVLDDVDGSTTAALREAGITDITVPNPNLNHIEGATIYPGLLITLVTNMSVKRAGSFYLDYTSSWTGCRKCIMPKVDIEIILTRWLLAAEGILAVTVCMRHLTLEKRRTHLDDMQADIERMGCKLGYAFERVHGAFYRNNYMAFLVLRSVARKDVDEVLPSKRKRVAPASFMSETHGGLKRAS